MINFIRHHDCELITVVKSGVVVGYLQPKVDNRLYGGWVYEDNSPGPCTFSFDTYATAERFIRNLYADRKTPPKPDSNQLNIRFEFQ